MGQKIKTIYVCSECGFESAKWLGRCSGCGEWNTLVEQIKEEPRGAVKGSAARLKSSYAAPVRMSDISLDEELRYHTGYKELDRVLGGGIVKGSLILLGGDPGIGKSTVLLQICENLSKDLNILYVSGEESKRQLKLRFSRLGLCSENLYVLAQTDVEIVMEEIKTNKPDVVMIDSIQTMSFSELSSSPGSISQVKECTNAFMRLAKELDISIILVGHVNKDGAIAGPKVLEHMVDAVLYFEGDRHLSYRILRAIKNRYGATNEIGVFQMSDKGLQEVENPSLMLLSGRPQNVSGTCIACVMEGSRPILAEVQGLVTTTAFGNARRMATGFDYNRLSLLLAVLEKRAGYFFSNLDAYINIVGGIRLDEPAADLAVALSLISGLKDTPINEKALAFGEIGLAGEVRSVSHAKERVLEAERLGFKYCVLPYHNVASLKDCKDLGIELIGVRRVREAFEALNG